MSGMDAGPYWSNSGITPGSDATNGGSATYKGYEGPPFIAQTGTVELGPARRRLAVESAFLLFFTFAIGFNLGLVAAGSRR